MVVIGDNQKENIFFEGVKNLDDIDIIQKNDVDRQHIVPTG